ncbi:hypothetical protein INR49_032427 [Caranx melampygus]|nr:hypothetical protein INR49_032427 [Caranx melampygus]
MDPRESLAPGEARVPHCIFLEASAAAAEATGSTVRPLSCRDQAGPRSDAPGPEDVTCDLGQEEADRWMCCSLLPPAAVCAQLLLLLLLVLPPPAELKQGAQPKLGCFSARSHSRRLQHGNKKQLTSAEDKQRRD